MNTISVQDDAELIANVNSWLESSIARSDSAQKIIQLPAGQTPLALYKSWEQKRPGFLNQLLFQQVDDVLTGPKEGCFKLFFEEHLPSYQKQFLPLSNSPIAPGIAILGVGTNGHLAFHEPEINLNLNFGCVRLSTSTCESLKINEPAWGVTYGAAHFLRCSSVMIIAKGSSKKAILETALNEKIPTSPLSYILKSHRNCSLVIDRV